MNATKSKRPRLHWPLINLTSRRCTWTPSEVLYVGVGQKIPLRIFEHVLVIFLFCDTVLLDHAFAFANLGVLHMFRELFQCILLSAILLNNA